MDGQRAGGPLVPQSLQKVQGSGHVQGIFIAPLPPRRRLRSAASRDPFASAHRLFGMCGVDTYVMDVHGEWEVDFFAVFGRDAIVYVSSFFFSSTDPDAALYDSE